MAVFPRFVAAGSLIGKKGPQGDPGNLTAAEVEAARTAAEAAAAAAEEARDQATAVVVGDLPAALDGLGLPASGADLDGKTEAIVAAAVAPVEDKVDAWLVRGNNSVPRLTPAPVAKSYMACTPGHGWTFGGSNLNGSASDLNATDEPLMMGTQHVRLVTNGAGGAYGNISRAVPAGSVDPDLYDFRFYFSFPAGSQPSLINVFADKTNVSSNDLTIYTIGGGSTPLNGYRVNADVLNVVEVPLRALNGSTPWAEVDKIGVRFTDANGVPAYIRFCGGGLVRKPGATLFPKGVISITADDSFGTQWTKLKPALDARGWKHTNFPIISQLDAPGWLSTAQLHTFHEQGHEIGFHATTGAVHALGHGNMTAEQRAAEYATGRTWMADNGFFSPSFAWPLGNHSPAADADCAKYFSVGLAAIQSHNEPLATSAPYARQRLNCGSQYAQVASAITKTAAAKSWLILEFHAIRDSGGTGNDVTEAQLATIMAAVEASGADVLPVGDVVRMVAA